MESAIKEERNTILKKLLIMFCLTSVCVEFSQTWTAVLDQLHL